MNRSNLSILQKRDTERKIMLKLKENKQRRQLKMRKQWIIGIIVFVMAMIFIYGMNLLFNSHSKTYALDTSNSAFPETQEVPAVHYAHMMQIALKVKAVTQAHVQEPSVYNPNIPMPKAHQEYLYKLCQERHLDYAKTLAVIKHESVFNQNEVSPTHDYGYFQINVVNHKTLSQKLHTANSPLNPYINMDWGTYTLAHLYSYWGEKGFHGERLDEVVWSSYNEGITGFYQNGDVVNYVQAMKVAVQSINKII